MKADKLILGVLGGVAVGALMGILFAPEKGSKTRKKILDKGSDYTDDLKYKFDGLLETMNNKYENIKQEGENLITEGKAKFNNTKI
jgi:gas vesicle protein